MTGRPLGSGADTVRVAPRTDQGGVRLFIGRALYQAIDSPSRVSIQGHDSGFFTIRAGADHAVAGTSTDGMPRVALGVKKCAELHINPEQEITFFAAVTRREIDVQQNSPPTGQMSGADFKALRKSLKLSQTALGKALGIHYRTVQRWELAGTGMTMAHYQALQVVNKPAIAPPNTPFPPEAD